MNKSKEYWKFGILLLATIFAKALTFFPDKVEWYSTHIYPYTGITFRLITGWIPFSIGDVLYFILMIWLILKLIAIIKAFNRKQVTWTKIKWVTYRFVKIAMWLYIIFNILWGWNYYRLGIAFQLQLKPQAYSKEVLLDLTRQLIQKVNASRIALGEGYKYPHHKDYFKTAIAAYNDVQNEYPFLKYNHTSLKKSLYGSLGNYMGFLGYYNPFSGEAQVNTAFLIFQQPYVACHEIAHQLGYASESEANFVGYLAATRSSDTAMHYSVYFDLFNYANRELFYRDSTAARNNYKLLDTLVKKDIISVRKFLYRYKNPFEPVVKLFYDQYLKANNQAKGMQSYNDVVGWLIAYRQKFGRL